MEDRLTTAGRGTALDGELDDGELEYVVGGLHRIPPVSDLDETVESGAGQVRIAGLAIHREAAHPGVPC